MINEQYFLKLPKDFKNKCKIYPPSVKEVVDNEYFSKYRYLLTITQEEIEDEFLNKKNENKEISAIPTPFEFLLATSFHNKEIEKLAKEAFYFFIKSPITFLYDRKEILLCDLEKTIKESNSIKDIKRKFITIKEDEYFDFQNAIRESLGEKKVEPPDPDEDPRVKRIKAKARYRDKIKAKKGMGISLGTLLASICCMGIGINPLNVGELSYASVDSLIKTYQEKEKYETDIRALIAGADSKKIKPKYWIRNLDE
nr:MAG TPA: hypothetical protein [Caudoviricetes sp.]